jgi:hypothetical protein
MIKLAESSGTVIYEAENKLYLSKSPAPQVSTFLFVTGVLGFILLGNGVLQLTVFKNQIPGSTKLGIMLIGIGLVFVAIFWRIRLYQKKVNAIPPHQLKNICIFDFGSKNLLDSQQNILTPLNQAWLSRKMQLSSSSPELLLCWKGGNLSIIKGNPFSGGIVEIEKLLLSKGIRKK